VCTLNKVWKTSCETNDVLLQDAFDSLCGKPQSARSTSGANMLDLRSEALAYSKPVTFCSFLVRVMVPTTKSGVCEGIGATCN
jgi:hypothetical protein